MNTLSVIQYYGKYLRPIKYNLKVDRARYMSDGTILATREKTFLKKQPSDVVLKKKGEHTSKTFH